MLSREDNELLTRTASDTPMGALLRQYWIPVVLSSEVAAGGRVKRVKLLGERLIAFRAKNGQAGLVGEFYPHRLASLYFGRVEEAGMRCISRLEVRDGWPVSRDAERATGVRLRVEDPSRRLPVCRAGRNALGVHGAGKSSAAPAASRMDPPARGAYLRVQARAGVQLVPGDGGWHRFEPHLVPSRPARPR